MIAVVLPGGGYAVLIPGKDSIDVVPGRPMPEHPTAPVRLLDTGDATWCSFGVRWPVDEEWLRTQPPDVLRTAGFTGVRSTIRVAVLGTPWVTLEVTNSPEADAVAVASAPSAGYPPFTTILHNGLGPDAASALRAALAGSTGRAFVTVHATLPPDLPLDSGVLSRTALHPGPDPGTVTAPADLAHWPRRTLGKDPSC